MKQSQSKTAFQNRWSSTGYVSFLTRLACLVALSLLFGNCTASAQVELACPTGTQVTQGGQAVNTTTNKVRQWQCVDNFGNVIGPGWNWTSQPPSYWYPTPNAGMTPNLIDTQGGTNMDIAAAGITANTGVASWVQFYLPFPTTITRWRFQMDGVGTSLTFYCGIYNYPALTLNFEIVPVALSAIGQYGKGAATDTGNNLFFDGNRNAVSTVTLQPGWYLFAWGASGTAGPTTTPKTGGYDALWNETVGVDTLGLQGGLVSRHAKSSTFNITGGHMPLTLGTASGGSATEPPNIAFFQ